MKKVTLVALALAALTACSKKDDMNSSNALDGNIAPSGFKYKTTKEVSVDVTVLTNVEQGINGVPVSIYGLYNNELNKVGTAVTDAAGNIKTSVSVPSYIDSFVVSPNYIGVINDVKTFISSSNSIKLTLGGAKGVVGNFAGTFSKSSQSYVGNTIPSRGVSVFDINGTKTNTIFKYVTNAGADALGKPNFLEPTNDVISKDLLANINYSVPEGKNLANSVKGSSYLSSNATSNINLVSASDVWLTFVHEGAGNRNSLGFYTYPTNNPPTSLANIDTITFVFPNSSLYGSGGNLQSGNKVKLGNFKAGTTIGFVLYSDGWNASLGGANVKTGNTAFFTDSYLNPEKKATNRKHTVLLDYKDVNNGNTPFYIVGFEDLNRESGGCDHDFNDNLFYVTSNPITAIDRTGILPVDIAKDSDGDGVSDALDAYPNDASKAYDTYYPSANQWGTLAFEDNWPMQGDYDLNDLVVSYRYKLVSNAQNKVVEIAGDFAPIAAGANYENALGIQLPLNSASVASVSGQRLADNYIKLNGNGTENGQKNAVFIPFDGSKQLINNPNGANFVNTVANNTKVSGDTVRVIVKLVSPIESLAPATFNPFLISDKRRGYEVHLPSFPPTDLADKTLFGTNSDASNSTTGTYYVTKNNYPFALNFADAFSYPVETISISQAYSHFSDWTLSGGKSYTDWYKNTGFGYRVNTNIYNK